MITSARFGRATAFALAVGLLAVVPAAVADLKIGYVNMVKAIEEAPQGVASLKKLEAEFGPRDKELVQLQNRVSQLSNELTKDTPPLKESERAVRERELLAVKRELKRATQEFREDYNLRRNEELAALQDLVRKAIVDIARQEKYDLILQEGVVYSGESVDITEKVLKRLGKP